MKNTCRQLVTTDDKAEPCSQHTKFTRLPNFTKLRLIALSALTLPMLAMAGNIPQYKVSKVGTPYTEITDGTALAMTFNGNAVLFANGRMYSESEVSQEGFPIGFDFRLGGRIFDQFAVDNYGNLYLGTGNVNVGTDAFRVGMSTISYGLSKATVSYKTEGEEGNRVMTVQYKNATVNETTSDKGKYNLQIRLHEADGKIEMAFKEIETCYAKYFGFATGLRGWDDDDTLWLTATGLDNRYSISTDKKPDMLNDTSYIKWDSEDYDNGYSPVFVFTPELDTTAPTDAPSDLTLTEDADNLLISCRKGADSAATMILISETPFTDADLPTDGESYRAGINSTTGGWYTKIGSSILLYYGNDDEINVQFPGLEAGKSYYICAISANGYPTYNLEGRAEQVLLSSQAAPEAFRISSNQPESISVNCKADYPVIIAATPEGSDVYGAGYAGVFGTPTADVKVGDELPGGGTVVYVGEPTGIKVDALPNQLLYFRGWTVDGDKVSATYLDGVGIPAVSFPYEPEIENYPLNSPLLKWEATEDEFMPMTRAYAGDRAVYAVSNLDTELSLTTPSFTSYRDMTLTFEFAMETEKAAAEGEDGVVLLQGYEPGKFGETGYFQVKSGEKLLKEIKEYNGTMKSASLGGYEDGSSTFETVEVAVPATGEPQTFTFLFSTPDKSRLYIRNLSLVQTGEAPALPENAPANIYAEYAEGDSEIRIHVTADRAEDAHGTLLLLSEDNFIGTPEDGKQYKAGDEIGNATVIYHDNDEHIDTYSLPISVGKEYVVTGLSHNPEGSFSTVSANVRLISTGVESIVASDLNMENAEIYNVAGIRIKVSSLEELPVGLYIINGKKIVIK